MQGGGGEVSQRPPTTTLEGALAGRTGAAQPPLPQIHLERRGISSDHASFAIYVRICLVWSSDVAKDADAF